MLYFLALFCLSTSPNWAKLSHMPPDVLGFWRLFLATTVLFVFFLSKKQKDFLKPPRKNLKWVLLSALFFFLHLLTYKYAAQNTTIANTTLLFASNPLWATLGGIFFFEEIFQKRYLLSYALAVISIYLLFKNSLDFSEDSFKGNAVALLSAFFYAVYMLTGKKARENYSNATYAFYQYGIAAGLFALTIPLNNHSFFENADTISWVAVAGLVALPTFLGHYSLTHLLKTMNITFMTMGKLIEPIFASIIAFVVFSEKLQSSFFISFCLTALSIMILFWPKIKSGLRNKGPY